MSDIKLHPSWLQHLSDEFEKPYMQDLKKFLKSELQKGKIIYPKPTEYFAAFDHAHFDQVRVVILGQDPYHGPGQAHGLCFSVQQNVPPPPSLVNIFKELEADLGLARPKSGSLIKWAQQGVLLLNAVLTVEAGKAASHRGKGWEQFTDRVIQVLNEKKTGLVFVLWGAYAQKKAAFVDRRSHFVIESPHPSPLSAHRGFFGTKPFSRINHYLTKKGEKPIDWSL